MSINQKMCLLGALVGDALGAPLEFLADKPSDNQLNAALQMSGGGRMKMGCGQITDDGELTLSLWQVLSKHDPHHGFPSDNVLRSYVDWFRSNPFDMGNTCRNSFMFAHNLILSNNSQNLTLKTKEHVIPKPSNANGALMRVTPIAQWVYPYLDISAETAAEYAREDASLSHAHKVCTDSNAMYTFALVHLLRGVSPKNVISFCEKYAAKYCCEVIQKWLIDSIDINDLVCTKSIGYVKYGLVMAFHFLRNPDVTFLDAMKIVLSKGGDTDTNAAIVGGMVCAYQEIPQSMLDALFNFDCTQMGIRRPREFSVKFVLKFW